MSYSKDQIGLPELVIRMRNEGKSEQEIVKKLEELQLSSSIIGALMHTGSYQYSDYKTLGKRLRKKIPNDDE